MKKRFNFVQILVSVSIMLIAICLIIGVICTIRDYKEFQKEEEARIVEKKRMEKYQDFRFARKGQVWIVDDCNILLLEEPCPIGYLTKDKIKCTIKSGSKMEIIARRAGGWKNIKVIPENDMGWIDGHMIKEAYKKGR